MRGRGRERERSCTNGNIVELIELVHQGPYDSKVNLHVPQLLQRQIVLDDTDDVAPYPVDVCVDGQVAVRIRHAAVHLVVIVAMVGIQPGQQRPPLVSLGLQWFRLSSRLRLSWQSQNDAPPVTHATPFSPVPRWVADEMGEVRRGEARQLVGVSRVGRRKGPPS
jgi:hypothetical protein